MVVTFVVSLYVLPWTARYVYVDTSACTSTDSFSSAVVQMIIAGSPAVMTAGTTGMPETTITVMIVTETIDTGMIVAGMIAVTAATAGIALGRLLAVVKSMIVAPGLPLPGGTLKTEGLQGTMTGEAAMMTAEALTLIMIAAVTMWTAVGTTVVGTRRTIGMTTGPRGTPTETAVGRAEVPWFSDGRFSGLRCGPRNPSPKGVLDWVSIDYVSAVWRGALYFDPEVIALCPSFALAMVRLGMSIPPVRMESFALAFLPRLPRQDVRGLRRRYLQVCCLGARADVRWPIRIRGGRVPADGLLACRSSLGRLRDSPRRTP